VNQHDRDSRTSFSFHKYTIEKESAAVYHPRAVDYSRHRLPFLSRLKVFFDHIMAPSDLTTASTVTLIAKFNKERITLDGLSESMTVGQVKDMLQERTRILPKRQKLVGLLAEKGGAKGVTDELRLSELKVKKSNIQFILMGTPEDEIFVDPSDRDDLPDVGTHSRSRTRASRLPLTNSQFPSLFLLS
jgi:hypothetical protein